MSRKRRAARWVPMHAKCGQMHVHLYVYIGPSAAKANARVHIQFQCATQHDPRMCAHVLRRHRRHPEGTMPIITYRPRSIPLLADSSRCCLIHATPRFHGGLLVLSRRGRVGFFGAHNEPQGQVWTSLHGFVASACPTRAGAGYSPSSSTSFLRSRRVSLLSGSLYFSLASFLRQGWLLLGGDFFLSPSATGKAYARLSCYQRGRRTASLGVGAVAAIYAASCDAFWQCMYIVNVDAIESFLLSKRRTWALFPR